MSPDEIRDLAAYHARECITYAQTRRVTQALLGRKRHPGGRPAGTKNTLRKGRITDAVIAHLAAAGPALPAEIATAVGFPEKQVVTACRNLIRTGRLIRVARGEGNAPSTFGVAD